MVLRKFTAATLAALAASCVSVSALAAPVVYNYSTAEGPISTNATLLALLGATSSVSGSFIYDAASPLTANSGDIGYEPGLAIYASGALSQLGGSVAGHSFIDNGHGTVAVGNEASPLDSDWLTLNADPTPRPGEFTPPVGASYPRQLAGFSVGDYTLHNVRLFWVEAYQVGPDFLTGQDLPTTLPTFYGRLALDFVLTSDPTNTENSPYYSRTVFFSGLTAVAAVPEPATSALALVGMVAVLAALRRRKA